MSEIKVLLYAPTRCVSPKTVHPGFSPCTLLICSNDTFSKKFAHSKCTPLKIVHRPWKCARRVQGAPLISDTVCKKCAQWKFMKNMCKKMHTVRKFMRLLFNTTHHHARKQKVKFVFNKPQFEPGSPCVLSHVIWSVDPLLVLSYVPSCGCGFMSCIIQGRDTSVFARKVRATLNH